MMKISVIIPSLNREEYIINLLNDLKDQTLKPEEIIIVDQSNSPYKLLQTHDLIHLIDGGKGPCRARNLGLEHSSGEIMVFLDDDIRLDPLFLETLCKPITNHTYLAVVGAICNAKGEYPQNEHPHWRKVADNWLLSITANPGFPGKCPTISFAAGCAAIHRCVYEEIGGFDPFFDPNGAGEDREYGLRIFHAGYPILYEGEAAVRHLGAPTGGRRGAGMGFKYQNILEANSVYIVAKYFSWRVFENFCSTWLRAILARGKGFNIRKWLRSLFWWYEARHYIKKTRTIKRDQCW
jgi:GT2 family glycosyltransferase